VDVEETESEIRITAELSGLEEKDLEVQLEGDTLMLKGRKQEERGGGESGWYERSYGSFQRTIPLRSEVEPEKASASYQNGVLHVTLPKSPAARQRTRRIPIQSGSSAGLRLAARPCPTLPPRLRRLRFLRGLSVRAGRGRHGLACLRTASRSQTGRGILAGCCTASTT
jgi:hypothetical protein